MQILLNIQNCLSIQVPPFFVDQIFHFWVMNFDIFVFISQFRNICDLFFILKKERLSKNELRLLVTMVIINMFLQAKLPVKAPPAYTARERLVREMDPFMGFPAEISYEGPLADTAPEGPFARVQPLV